MNRPRTLLVVATLAGAAGLFVGRLGGADAASGKPALAATFGPIQVDAASRATFFLALQNTGAADAMLALGDKIEIAYGTGGGAGDLLAAGQAMTVGPLPGGIVAQQILNGSSAEIGVRLAVTADVTIPAGSAQVFTLEGATASTGGAPVAVAMKFAKTAGKTPKALALSVVKTPPVAAEDFYGDGADGSPTIADGASLQTLRGYVDFVVPAGATVTASSGTTIRCTGKFENHGTIVVTPGSPGGGLRLDTSDLTKQVFAPTTPVERGDALASPSMPGATNSQAVTGAQGGLGLGTAVQSLPLSHYRVGGGGGTGTLGVIGGAGGGVLRVLARGPIVNAGNIVARGGAPSLNRTGQNGGDGAGAGGGGGGIVILASGTSVENATSGGLVDVSGGNGGTADLLGGAGGGGGGGLVVFCAPVIVANGTTNLAAGLSGFPTLVPNTPTNQTYWAGGGGGCACVGDGGYGGPVQADGTVGPPAGQDPPFPTPGQLVVRTASPLTLWR